ncbi:MAG: tetratricopeptide repeat protein [Nitrospirae bacterium]|nr:tetratricopeptide repeat protein [Nitrospirota bacterium]
MKYYIILILLVIIAFANSLQNSFVWDDHGMIVNNPMIVLPFKEIPSIFMRPLWNTGTQDVQVYYRPVLNLYLVLNYKLWGPSPLGFHLVNIMLHLINAILLYKVGLLLFGNDNITRPFIPSHRGRGTEDEPSPSVGEGKGEGRFSDIQLISIIAASIFAVHPVHNEPVGRPVAGGESLLGFFIILSLYFFLKERRYLSLFSFSLALLSKEFTVMFPFSLVTLAIHKKGIKRGIVEIIPYMILVGLYLILRMMVVDSVFGNPIVQPIFARILTMAVATFDYLRLLLVPYPINPFYPARWYESILEPKVLLAIIILIAIVFLTFKTRRDKTMLFLLLSPFIMLAPAIWRVNAFWAGPDQVYIAERYLYVPAMFFLLFIPAAIMKIAGNRVKKYLITGLLAVMLIFISITVSSNTIWRDDLTFFSKIVRESPGAVFAHNNLGIALRAKGLIDKAEDHFRISMELDPYYSEPYINLGNIYFYDKNLPSKAKELYKTVLMLKPDSADTHNILGYAYHKEGWIDKAIEHYLIAIKLKPNYPEAHNNLGIAYSEKNRIDKAVEHYLIAIKLKPNYPEAYYNLGVLYKNNGMLDAAITNLQAAVRLKPDYSKAHYYLGDAYFAKGWNDAAIRHYNMAANGTKP